eukprot:TRINITY_DN18452_c0_g1_i1.p1 TRINITY_DN18452_c0_g1~~TRINITY_DN18452_c0_g1_i1.p1  ORF type:complete len:655 (-),score=144.50 TRINITY_DN18452_c0_g1_i1:937-2901(-)
MAADIGLGLAPGVQIAPLGQGDHLLGHPLQLLGLGVGGLDLLVLEQRGDHVAKHGPAVRGGAAEPAVVLAVSHFSFVLASSSSRAGKSSRLMPRDSPISVSISLISFKDLRPKFLVLSISDSLFCTNSPMYLMSAFFRQLALRTLSSSSSTVRKRFSLRVGSSSVSSWSGSGSSWKLMNMDSCSLRILAAQATASSGRTAPLVYTSRVSLSQSVIWPTRAWVTTQLTLMIGLKAASRATTPMGSSSLLLRSAVTQPLPVLTVSSARRRPSGPRLAMTCSGLRISTSGGAAMSPAVTTFSPLASMLITAGSWPRYFRRTPLRFRMMSLTSSITPLMVENSCSTPSMRTLVIAAPCKEEIRMRLRALPMVWPKPRSSGSQENLPQYWVWDSSSTSRRDGLMSSLQFLSMTSLQLLAGVTLYDELHRHGTGQLLAVGQGLDRSAELVGLQLQPLGHAAPGHRLQGLLELRNLAALVLDRHHIAGFYPGRGDVHPAAVDGHVAVAHPMAGLGPAAREAQAVDHVVQPELQEHQQVVAGHPAHAGGAFVGQVELLLGQAVHTLDLLLFPKLQTVVAGLAAALAVLARREGAALHGALVGKTTVSLEVKLLYLASAEPAHGTSISSQISSSVSLAVSPALTPGAAWAGGSRCGARGLRRG